MNVDARELEGSGKTGELGLKSPIDNLIELIEKHCSGKEIKAILRKAHELNKNVTRGGKKKPEILANLRDALGLKAISSDDLYDTVHESEESGSQFIRLYVPNSEGVKARCNDALAVAESLFGVGWRETMGFPRSLKDLKGEDWGDFRIQEMGAHGANWIARLEVGVQREIKPTRRVEGRKSIIEREIVDRQETYLVKWHHHGLLEIRTPIGKSNQHREESRARVIGALRKSFAVETDFEELSLPPALTRIRRLIDSPGGSDLFHWINAKVQHPRWGKADLQTWTAEENILEEDGGKGVFDRYGDCQAAGIRWKFDQANVILGENRSQLTYIGQYGRNTILIRSDASAKAVRYVVDQLRLLAQQVSEPQ